MLLFSTNTDAFKAILFLKIIFFKSILNSAFKNKLNFTYAPELPL